MVLVLQLSEGVQQDPCDNPARELFLESPNPSGSIMPSSVGGENPPASCGTTDYPEPSSAASWARAQRLQQQQQQQRPVPGSLTGGYSGSTAAPLSSGLCHAVGYNPSGMGIGDSTYHPASLNYGGGPMPPSSRGGVSGYSGGLPPLFFALRSAVCLPMRSREQPCLCVANTVCSMHTIPIYNIIEVLYRRGRVGGFGFVLVRRVSSGDFIGVMQT